MARKPIRYLGVADSPRVDDTRWPNAPKWCICSMITGCQHAYCPTCNRQTVGVRHADDDTLAGSNCHREPLALEQSAPTEDAPPPPHPRSILWCLAGLSEGECQTQPLDRFSLVAMQEHVMRDHGVAQEALRFAHRVALDIHTREALVVLGPREAWPRELDLKPVIIAWVTAIVDGQYRGPLYAAFRTPPALADALEERTPEISFGWSVQP